MNYKIGDKVKVKEKFWEIESSDHVYRMEILAGRTLEVEYIDSDGLVSTKQDDSKDDTRWSWDKNWVELYNTTITWDTLKWKDVLVNRDGDEQTVLLIANDLVFLSESCDFKKITTVNHKKELQNLGYTIKQATPVEEPKETIEVDGNKYKLIKE